MQAFTTAKLFEKMISLAMLMLFGFTSMALSQPAEIPFHSEPYSLYSGKFDGQKGTEQQATLAYNQIIEFRGVPWMRVLFTDVNLGTNSYVNIVSLLDGALQRLDAVSMAQWQNSSAYFNGDAVEIQLYVAPGDVGVFVQVDEVIVGDWAGNGLIESQCGPTDDREPSADPAVGRLLNVGCTGWLINNGLFITAGHCVAGGSANVMEFNVPLSTAGGTIQHPGPEDQYSVNTSTIEFTNGGIGNDWAKFEVFNNSVTGLHPISAQGASFTLAQDYGPPDIRITGYGVDNGSANQTQQTHVGPNVGSSGNTMRYQTDTEGGNSGSPVIDDATGFAVGVHTHGGCTTSGTGNNNGTSTFHPDFWAAVNVPGVLVPNPPSEVTAYSDYTTPTSILVNWEDPTTLVNGDTLLPEMFAILIERDGTLIDTVESTIRAYLDTGLVDGTEYTYTILTYVDSTGFKSPEVETSWIAGGSPVPNPPENFSVSGTQTEVKFSWANPLSNIDGTPMDDFAGINLYRNGELETTFVRATTDTGAVDSALYSPSDPGFYEWHITAIDNETPVNNESDSTAIIGTPLSIPVSDEFTVAGDPDPGVWINSDAEVNDRADNPPSGPYALNLNGMPNGGDRVDLKPIDLSGMTGSNIQLSYYYQPQGQGNAPEPEDSLRVYFKNDMGNWILVRAYEGAPVQPFIEQTIDIETAPNGGGSYFFGQFQIRFESSGGAGVFPNDDWFIDNVELGFPVGIAEETAGLPMEFAVKRNYPNPFNPSTTIEYQLPQQSDVKLVIYNTLGQRVRTLLNQSVESGYHQLVWDGKNDQGQQVSSGIYIYRFEASAASGEKDYRQVRKMILLK